MAMHSHSFDKYYAEYSKEFGSDRHLPRPTEQSGGFFMPLLPKNPAVRPNMHRRICAGCTRQFLLWRLCFQISQII